MLSPFHPLQMVFGLIVWSGWFVFIYGGAAIACAVSPPDPGQGATNWLNGVLLVLGLLLTLFLLFSARRCWLARPAVSKSAADKATQRFIASAAAGVYLVSALATLAVGLPALTLPPCV